MSSIDDTNDKTKPSWIEAATVLVNVTPPLAWFGIVMVLVIVIDSLSGMRHSTSMMRYDLERMSNDLNAYNLDNRDRLNELRQEIRQIIKELQEVNQKK